MTHKFRKDPWQLMSCLIYLKTNCCQSSLLWLIEMIKGEISASATF